ncbi:MAG: hypothetical protein J6B24_11765, partial [Clostridia bacterium]|nr:hypothetical protein [Clostridia bacterium]
ALAGELRCRTFGSVHFHLIETRRVSFLNSPNGRISHARRAYFTLACERFTRRKAYFTIAVYRNDKLQFTLS